MARIAVLVSNPCVGDARVIKMARAAAEGGHEVHVFATQGQGAEPFVRDRGVTFYRFAWRPTQMLAARAPWSWLSPFGRKATMWFGRRAVPYRRYGLFREVFGAHVAAIRPDIIHAHDLITLPTAIAAGESCNARVVYDAHELEVHRNPPLPPWQRMLVRHTERAFAPRCAAVITVGDLVREELAKEIRRSDITVIYNSPIEAPSPRTIRQDLRLAADEKLIVYVGKVTLGRGVGDVVRQLAALPGVHFAAVGPSDPPTLRRLRSDAERTGVGARFHLLPPVPFDQVVSYISGADVGIIPIEPVTLSYRYSMPNKLFELMFANVPIVSNDLDDIRAVITRFGNGRICNFETGWDVAAQIGIVLADKPCYLLDEARMHAARQQYGWPEQKRKLLQLYERILER